MSNNQNGQRSGAHDEDNKSGGQGSGSKTAQGSKSGSGSQGASGSQSGQEKSGKNQQR